MSNHELPDELSETAERLRSHRPELDIHGLDRVHGRVVGRAPRPGRRTPQSLAIALCVALGLVFSGAGGALALSDLSSDGSAASAQYSGQQAGDERAQSPTLGDPGDPGDPGGSGGVSGEQAVRQVNAVSSSKELPFTGGASLLILGLGGVLLLTGAVLRWRVVRGHDV